MLAIIVMVKGFHGEGSITEEPGVVVREDLQFPLPGE